jgi:hypothetical protein
MVEDDERLAQRLLEEGLEQALREKENAIDGIQPYVVDSGKSEAIQADAWGAYRIAAAEVKADADTTWAKEKRRLFGVNRDALKAVEEWRASLKPTNERERQRKQRGPLLEAIQEVHECALNRGKSRRNQRRTSSTTR